MDCVAEPLKRYLVFGLISYYPSGGWGDFRSSHETLEEAIAAGEDAKIKHHDEWYEIVDCQTGDYVDIAQCATS